jgi:hypothetical protein
MSPSSSCASTKGEGVFRFRIDGGSGRRSRLELPVLGLGIDLAFSPFEVKTLIADGKAGRIEEAGILEELMPFPSP